jgi:ABC-type multidrug transport system ATPase subunit
MDCLMLNVRSVTKRYGRAIALDAATFDLAAGEVTALVGANGAGKSTLIKAITGLVRFEGQILVDGIDVRRDGRAARRRIGYLAQHAAFHADLNVRETARFYAELRGESIAHARAILERRGLAEHEEKLVGALSGGMRQRLALAVAEFGDPGLLVLDEPSTGLDVSARLELRQFIRDQRELGKTILLSTHWLEDVPSIADRAIALEQGKIVFDGAAGAFAAAHESKGRLFLRLNGHTADAIPLLQGTCGTVGRSGEWLSVTCAADERARVLESLVAAGISIKDFRLEEAAGAVPAGGTNGGWS